MTSPSPPLSVCMIVKNEASNLCGMLESIRTFADEIVVVDTGSTDNTADLARRYTRCIYTYPWHDDFAAARNFSLDKARGSYCLWLDADDRIDAVNGAKINALKKHFDGLKAFAFELQDFRNGSLFRSLLQVRCIPNRKDVRFRGRVHESIDWDAIREAIKVVHVDIAIRHHGYDDPALVAKKAARNLRLLHMEQQAGRDDATLHYYLALSYDHLGISRAAAEHMARAINRMERERFSAGAPRSEKLSDFWVDALLYLAKSMITEGKKREALRCVVKLRCAELQDSPSLFRLADLYQDLGEHREALRLLARVDPQKRASSFFPTPPLTTTHVVSRTAFSLLVLGLREEALHCIESLPDQTLQKDVWQAVGLLAGDRGHDALVHEAFGRALRFGELTAKAWDQWGVAWKRAGKRHKAEVCWRKALLLDSDLESARIHLANMLWDVGRTAEAYEMFKSLVDNGCQKVPVLLAFAILAAERGHESALGRVREALEVWLQNNTASPHHDLTLREGIFGKLAHVLEREQKIHLAKIAQRLALRETSKPISRQTAAPSRAS